MLACDGAAGRNTKSKDLVSRELSPFQIARLARVERDDGMHVAITGMEDVTDLEAVLLSDLLDCAQGRCDLGSGDDPVLHIVSRADASDRSKRVLPPFPEKFPLCRGFGYAHLP